MSMFNMFASKINNNIDSTEITIERKKIIKRKYFLKKIYTDFYLRLRFSLSEGNRKGFIVELGSGGGFIKEIIPKARTSDILKLPDIDMCFSALDMPFKKKSVNAFVMIDVLHHINNVEKFFTEANRCLKKDGQIIMIEPASTILGKFVYKYFHHEPYNPKGEWSFKSSGPLSGANSALPWIVFFRDRKKFKKMFPDLMITRIEIHTPLMYLLSGGFSIRQLVPDFFYYPLHSVELLLSPFNKQIGLFYTIVVTRK